MSDEATKEPNTDELTRGVEVTAQEVKQCAERLKVMAIAERQPDIVLAARLLARMVTQGYVITTVHLAPLISEESSGTQVNTASHHSSS